MAALHVLFVVLVTYHSVNSQEQPTQPAPLDCSLIRCPDDFCPNPIPAGPNECCDRCLQDCRAVLCLRPNCTNPIVNPGECCGVCPGDCSRIRCQPPICPNPLPPRPNECCKRCNQDCRLVLCPQPPCSNPIFRPGECCGECPRPPVCPIPGQVFSDCHSACPPTCDNPNPVCTRQCVQGCGCPNGTVLDSRQRKCVPQSKCSCPIPGQVFGDCNSACPPTCDTPNPVCTQQCVQGCACPRETVLDTRQGKCVPRSNCTCTIPGQVYSDCHSACPSTCDQPGALICPAVCVQGCACGRGTVFDKNQRKCVPQSKCKCPPTCSKNFCQRKPWAMCNNPGPREIPGCSGGCQLTFCGACYNSVNAIPRPEWCPKCYGTGLSGSQLKSCLKNWARCVYWSYKYFYRRHRNTSGGNSEKVFRCWNPPCPFRG